jgi:hypothetical protein
MKLISEQGTAPGGDAGSALFSADRRYRFELRRAWDPCAPARKVMVWVMLNPSKAGAERNDPTVTRCRGFAVREGCNEIIAVNLHALVSTSPAALLSDTDPVGQGNDEYIRQAVRCPGAIVVLAWGEHGGRPGIRYRADRITRLVTAAGVRPFTLGLTQGGQPVHPLRIPATAQLIQLTAPEEPCTT